jgi:16S rRNA (guanine966-N2)-methyltransferase
VTRIIAGAARGRRLVVPPGSATRPTADRAREGLFSSIVSALGDLDGLRVLDLYAGSGAVGLEALSRGAASALLVDSDAAALRALRANVAALGLPGAEVVAAKAERLAERPPSAPCDVAFLDPPYAVTDDDVRAVLAALRANGWLAPDALVVVERASRGAAWEWPEGLEGERSRRYGEATLWYGRAAQRSGPT